MSWPLTIAHRKAINRVRSAEASSRRDTSYHHNNSHIARDETLEAVEASFEATRVRAALDALSPVQHEALDLAYFEGHTYTEVATMLHLPVGTAKSRIRDGLIRLREVMEHDEERATRPTASSGPDRGWRVNLNTVQLELHGCSLVACPVLVGGRPIRIGGCRIWCRWVC